MLAQWLAVGLIVTFAAVYVIRKSIRTWTASNKSGCGGGCGSACGSSAAPKVGTSAFVPVGELTVRSRNRE